MRRKQSDKKETVQKKGRSGLKESSTIHMFDDLFDMEYALRTNLQGKVPARHYHDESWFPFE